MYTYGIMNTKEYMPNQINHYQAIARFRKSRGFTLYIQGDLKKFGSRITTVESITKELQCYNSDVLKNFGIHTVADSYIQCIGALGK